MLGNVQPSGYPVKPSQNATVLIPGFVSNWFPGNVLPISWDILPKSVYFLSFPVHNVLWTPCRIPGNILPIPGIYCPNQCFYILPWIRSQTVPTDLIPTDILPCSDCHLNICNSTTFSEFSPYVTRGFLIISLYTSLPTSHSISTISSMFLNGLTRSRMQADFWHHVELVRPM